MRTLIASFFILLSLSAAAMACPTVTPGSTVDAVTGQFLYTARSYSVTAGGSQQLRSCGYGHTGFVNSQPNFTFYTAVMHDFDRLEIEVTQQSCNTVLLVRSANGSWFFDDDSGGNQLPRVNLYGTSNHHGDIYIWVGTYGSSTCSATLEIETWYN